MWFQSFNDYVHWKDLCWSWNSNTLATWCEEQTHLNRPWCWERLRAGGKGDDRGWDGWMASPNQWTRVWVNSESWWWTGRPGMLQSMGSQRVIHDWAELTELIITVLVILKKKWVIRNLQERKAIKMKQDHSLKLKNTVSKIKFSLCWLNSIMEMV